MDFDALVRDCIDFARRLIQTPSLTYEEAAIASLIREEMVRLGFDEVWLDGMGNLSGRLFGRDRSLPAVVLNAHTDHVDPGDLSLWPVPPYAGEIQDGRLIGRGAADIKGPLAVQVYAMAAFKRAGEHPRRDIVFTGVVQEEIGGPGAIYWVEHLDYPVDLVVLAEPSDNRIALGHRGGFAVWVKFLGRSVHASVPQAGENPNYYLATFLARLAAARGELSAHPYLGQTTVAPTIVEVDTKSKNVIPAWTRVLLDFRTSSESPKGLLAFVTHLARGLPHEITPGWSFPLDFEDDATIVGVDTPPDSPAAVRARELISAGVGYVVPFSSYQFATDGRLFPPYGITNIIGYSPAEEPQAHIAGESISLEKMAESLQGYIALLRDY